MIRLRIRTCRVAELRKSNSRVPNSETPSSETQKSEIQNSEIQKHAVLKASTPRRCSAPEKALTCGTKGQMASFCRSSCAPVLDKHSARKIEANCNYQKQNPQKRQVLIHFSSTLASQSSSGWAQASDVHFLNSKRKTASWGPPAKSHAENTHLQTWLFGISELLWAKKVNHACRLTYTNWQSSSVSTGFVHQLADKTNV